MILTQPFPTIGIFTMANSNENTFVKDMRVNDFQNDK